MTSSAQMHRSSQDIHTLCLPYLKKYKIIHWKQSTNQCHFFTSFFFNVVDWALKGNNNLIQSVTLGQVHLFTSVIAGLVISSVQWEAKDMKYYWKNVAPQSNCCTVAHFNFLQITFNIFSIYVLHSIELIMKSSKCKIIM